MIEHKELMVQQNIRIRFNETDALGIVWHGNYLKYFEDGREAFGREHGISYLDAKKNGYATPVVKTSTDHKLTLTYGENTIIETYFINTDSAKLIFKYIIKNEASAIVCVGETIQVFTSLKDNTMSLIIPEFFKAWKIKQGFLNV
ncbi:acyl-CoA thioesterase [Confluentibacter flavum]|uniref:4-hydroxybenzoyl-CoA thioesterase n=1 Tax=Confluentibacter flavum TaxID=1909700 RepID=A0A2N3HKU4_9FLAO|nr:thioesterase family protein [Confluentibacter flavum]PKQ45478.1 4-hydroxybenzoyl-CoA thioesterase [Confluentibacter flavum]